MEGLKILSIIIGIFGALLGVYFREAIRKAYQVKTIATRLDAYLRTMNQSILEIEDDSKQLFYLGKLWQKERSEAYAKGGEKAFIEVDKNYEEQIDKMKQAILAGDDTVDNGIKKQYEMFREMDNEIFQFILNRKEQTLQNIIDNKIFISDEEAAVLSWSAAHRVVDIKTYVTKMIHLETTLCYMLRKMEKLELEAVRGIVFSIAHSTMKLSMDIDPLQVHVKNIINKPILKLALKYMAIKA